MKEYQLEGYIITVGQSTSDEIIERFLDSILDFGSIPHAIDKNKAVYCYNLDAYKEKKGFKPNTNIIKDTKIIGILDDDIIITFENLGICKELVCKISKSIVSYWIE